MSREDWRSAGLYFVKLTDILVDVPIVLISNGFFSLFSIFFSYEK